jgi:hypothetical protein
MDPKELAKLYEKKSAMMAAETAEKQAQIEARQAEIRMQEEHGRTAIRDVVIPYFQELVSTFPAGALKFDPAAKMDADTQEPVAVSFKIGECKEHVIEVQQGIVHIYAKRLEIPPRPGRPGKGKKRITDFPGLTVTVAYSGRAEPFIAVPSDLTREKLGNLIKLVIETDYDGT